MRSRSRVDGLSHVPASEGSTILSIALVLALLASGVLGFYAIGSYAFGRSEPAMYWVCGAASVVTAIVLPASVLVGWYVRRRRMRAQRMLPPAGVRLTALICLVLGCAATVWWVVVIARIESPQW